MKSFVFSLIICGLLVSCQSGDRSNQLKPKGLLGDEVAMSPGRLARMCSQDSDCVGFEHPCGNVIPVLKWEYEDFAKDFRTKNANRKFDCRNVRKGQSVLCQRGSCVTSATL